MNLGQRVFEYAMGGILFFLLQAGMMALVLSDGNSLLLTAILWLDGHLAALPPTVGAQVVAALPIVALLLTFLAGYLIEALLPPGGEPESAASHARSADDWLRALLSVHFPALVPAHERAIVVPPDPGDPPGLDFLYDRARAFVLKERRAIRRGRLGLPEGIPWLRLLEHRMGVRLQAAHRALVRGLRRWWGEARADRAFPQQLEESLHAYVATNEGVDMTVIHDDWIFYRHAKTLVAVTRLITMEALFWLLYVAVTTWWALSGPTPDAWRPAALPLACVLVLSFFTQRLHKRAYDGYLSRLLAFSEVLWRRNTVSAVASPDPRGVSNTTVHEIGALSAVESPNQPLGPTRAPVAVGGSRPP